MPPRRPSCGSSATASVAYAPRAGAARCPRCSARAPEDVTYTSFDGAEIPAFLFRPPRRLGRAARCPRSSTPTAARRAATATSGTGTPSTSSTRATRGWRSTSAARPGYGRDFERLNHGDWGVGDTKDCLAAGGLPPHARLGRRRPARHLRRELRVVHGAARGHGRPRASLPLRRAASTATATS